MPSTSQETEATDRRGTLWRYAGTLMAREHLDIPLQWQYCTHVSVYLFVETSVPCQLPQYSEYVLEKKRMTKKPLHRRPLRMQPLMHGAEAPTQTLDAGAGVSLLLRAHPRRGQARPSSTLLATAIKRFTPNEISQPKMNSHMGTAIHWGFNYPWTQNPHLINMARSVNWKQHARLSSGFVSIGDPVTFY